MANVIDYILANCQKSFEDLALNELDLACLNELAYLPLADWAKQDLLSRESIVLKDHLAGLEEVPAYDFLVTKDRLQLLKTILASARFADLSLSFYCNEISSEFERQFAAMVLELPEIDHRQVVFRGTDDSLIGWKEDFQMTYMREIPAQRMASAYLKDYLTATSGPVVLTGHSKGGNLAVYAASYQPALLQEQIGQIYIFDAPGLHPTVLGSSGYQAIKGKIQAIRPKESIVGVMLTSDVASKLVDSKAVGFDQHLMTTWEVDLTGHFIEVAQATDLSLALEETFKIWNQTLSRQELKIFFDTFFNLFLDNGIASLNDFIKWDRTMPDKLGGIFKDLSELDAQKRLLMHKSLTLLVKTFGQTSLSNQKEKLHQVETPFASWFKGKDELFIKINDKTNEKDYDD